MRRKNSAYTTIAKPLLDIEALRAQTPGCEKVIHFNNAGCGLLTSSVLDAMVSHLHLESEIGGYEASALRAAEVAEFHSQTAALLNTESRNIAFAGSATHAYANALSAIPFQPDDVILTTRNDFISNQIAFLALRKRFGVRIVHAPDLPEGGVDVEAMAALMRRERPRLVAATQIPTNSGLVQPVARIGRHCRELDLLYLVDACQSVGQLEIDVAELGCDFLTATCRKFLRGPRATGFLYASDRVLAQGLEPLFIDMHGARWTAPGEYQTSATAQRFEEWEMPYAAVIGSAHAVRYARDVGLPAIADRTRRLSADLRRLLAGLDGVRVLDHGEQLGALVTIAVQGWEPRPFKKALDARGVNSALSFREFAQFDFGVDKDVDWALRLSPHYYNTAAEVDAVVDVIRELTWTPRRARPRSSATPGRAPR